MPEFQYVALDRQGQSLTGWIATPSKQQAISNLAQQGRFVTEIDERTQISESASAGPATRSRWFGQRRVPLRLKASMFTQLSTALSAGLPLLPALRIIQEQATQPALRDLVEDLANRVQ